MNKNVSENSGRTIRVRAPARLHFGFFDLHGGLDRLFGSVGVSLEEIATEIEVSEAQEMSASGPGAERALAYAERVLAKLNIRKAINIDVQQAIPEHAGLGSGTQMALATGVAINALFDTGLEIEKIAALLSRGHRSGIGIATFRHGGLVVDGGRSADTEVPPVISRLHFPGNWRFVLVLDRAKKGVHGQQELQAFDKLGQMQESVSGELCRLLLVRALPALVEHNCEAFGSAISVIQQRMGEYFASAQSGVFSSRAVEDVIRRLQHEGALGVGQSSWGPTGFALFDSETEAYQALKQTRSQLTSHNPVEMIICRAKNTGATVGEIKAGDSLNVKTRKNI